MAIDYLINYPCPIKAKIGVEALVQTIKQRNQAEAAIGMIMKQTGKSRNEASQIPINVVVHRSEGDQIKSVKPQELLTSTKVLDEMIEQNYCMVCPVSSHNYFGCYNIIHYPISKKAEEWLAEITKQAIEATGNATVFVLQIIKNKINGVEFQKLRMDKNDSFFELREPITINAENKKDGKITINTSQVLEALFAFPKLTSEHIAYLLMFTNKLTLHNGSRPELPPQALAVEIGKDEWAVFELAINNSDDPSTQQLKYFFRSAFYAYAFHCEMLVNY